MAQQQQSKQVQALELRERQEPLELQVLLAQQVRLVPQEPQEQQVLQVLLAQQVLQVLLEQQEPLVQ